MEGAVLKSMRDSFQMTKQRCYNPNTRDFKHYGGRGITICERWPASFDNFVADMGLRPAGHTLERVDNNGPYSPENCVWASRKEQAQNRRVNRMIEFNGETHSISEWERRLGWKPGVLKARLGRLGYSVKEAFAKPVKCGGVLPGKHYPRLHGMMRNTSKLRPQPPKLTGSQLVEIRILVAAGLSRSLVGRAYGVTTTTISNVVDMKGAYRAR